MNVSPELLIFLRLLARAALEVTLVVGVAEGLARLTASAPWRRIIWQGCLVSVMILAAAELSGLGGELASWTARIFTRTPKQVAVAPSSVLKREDPQALTAIVETITGMPTTIRATELVTFDEDPNPLKVRSDRSAIKLLPRPKVGFVAMPDHTLTFDAAALVLIWMVGVIWFLGRTVAARVICSSLLWRQQGISPRLPAIGSVDTLAQGLGIRRRVRFFESARLRSPVAFGEWRPTIGIPAGLTAKFSPVQLAAMLAHELAHLANRDPFWYFFSDVVAAILWWHPLLWFARRRLRDTSERTADEASLLIDGGPQALAECLVLLGQQQVAQSGPTAPGFEGTGFRSSLAQRVERLCLLRTGRSWQPLGRTRSTFARVVGSMTLVATVIVGGGWTNSQTINQGESMKTIRNIWTQSLSALALLAVAGSGATTPSSNPPLAEPPVALSASTTTPAAANHSSSALVKDAALLFEMGNYDAAAQKYHEALQAGTADEQAIAHDLALIDERRLAQAASTPRPAAAESAPQPVAAPASQPSGVDPRLIQRYGLTPKGSLSAAGMSPGTVRSSGESVPTIQSRLDQIAFDEVLFQSLPLTEVLKFLNDESRKRDPMKTGVNFLINPNASPDQSPAFSIDPTTGVPVPQAQSEPMDMAGVTVNFNLPLRNVRLTDVLNAIVKVADKRIQFSVEEYGVVFSPGPGRSPAVGTPLPTSHPSSALSVRTFRVDTNTFLAGLESAFGITPAASAAADRTARSREIQAALRKLMQQLGVNMDDPMKAVFYNDLTGVLMVRATPGDLELVEAAVETLGGTAAGRPVLETGAVGVGSAETAPNAYVMDKELMRRYGLLPANNANSNSLK